MNTPRASIMDSRQSVSLSVVVPAFNARRTLLRALESVANQTTQVQQTIVVDDGSEDDTVDIALSMNATVLRTGGQKGPSAARNLGCLHASGDLVAFLDADDVWYESKIEAQVEAMREDPDSALCYTRFVRFPSGEVPPFSDGGVAKAERRGVRDVLRNPYLGTPTVVARASVIRELGGFNLSYRYGEDVDLWMRIAARYPVLCIPSVLCAVEVSQNSLTATGGEDVDRGNLAVLDAFELEHPAIAKKYRADLRFIRGVILTRIASARLGRRDRLAALSGLIAALRVSPTNKRALYLLVRSMFPLR